METIKKHYNLEARTESFSINIINFVKKPPLDLLTKILISQLIKSGTSIGANYCEANNAGSKRDFVHKISICKKEARETIYWLTILRETIPVLEDQMQPLITEAKELLFIFGAIIRSSKKPPLKHSSL